MEESGASSSSSISTSSRRRRSSPITSTNASRNSKEDGSRTWSLSPSSRGNPCGKAFRLYAPPAYSSTHPGPGSNRGVIVRRPLVVKLTKDIIKTYQICNPSFNYSDAVNPKRFLTNPSTGLLNDGYDNENSDLILYVNLVLLNQEANKRYVVKDLLGQGTFGQVAKCCDLDTNTYSAVKIIKNQPAYYQQSLVEVSLLYMLNQRFDPDNRHHIVRILDHFLFKNHLCISFEMLGSNLFELIKMNSFKGLSVNIVQTFSKQILQALVLMKDAGIIHCDLKPENILISKSANRTEIKVIDFGSACMEGRTIYSYIQSRYYRSPEVLLGYPYTTSIDMWSFGCIVAELFLGLPLFPGASEYDLLKRMIEILGGHPPNYLLRDAKNTKKFFKHVGITYRLENYETTAQENSSDYRVLTEEEYETRESKRLIIGKRYFNYVKLEDIIANYPYRKSLPKEEILKEKLTRLALVDFLRGLVEFDPGKRWSPLQASGHPFVTGEPFRCPYQPPPETPQIPVIRTVTVEHNPGGGHWLAAGLSLQVSNVNNCLPHDNLQFQKVPMSYGSSYGSLGAPGSYNDNYRLGSSYGSYGEFSSLHSYYSTVGPCGFNPHMQVGGPFLGFSPDARNSLQRSQANGFGTSPGGLRTLPLGASPSQYTPPNSHISISSASPGNYGPTSPSRGGPYGVSLGKAAAVGQYNKRNWGQPMMGMQPYESFQHGSVHCDGISVSYPDAQYQMQSGSQTSKISGHSNSKLQRSGRNGASSSLLSYNFKGFPAPHENVPNLVASRVFDDLSDKPESSSTMPDPADWDPNYSDESLLQEDNSDISKLDTEFTNVVHVSGTRNPATQYSGFGRARLSSSSFIPSNQRTYGSVQTHSFGEGSPSTTHDAHGGRPPHFPQKIPSRFGQQYDNSNNIKSTDVHRGSNHQHSQPSHHMADSHSSTNVIFTNSMPWGGRVGHSSTLPSCHPRQDCGRL